MPDTVFRPPRTIIPAPDMGVLRSVERLVTEQRRLLQHETERLAARERDAEERGWQAGYRAGLAAVATDMTTLSKAHAEQLESISGDLGRLVVDAMRRVLDMTPPAQRIEAAVERSLADHARHLSVEVSVGPAEFDIFTDLIRTFAAERRIEAPRIKLDPLLSPGEIVLSGPFGRRHIGYAARFARCADRMTTGE